MALDLDFVRNYLRVDHEEDDSFILLAIKASQSFVETYLNQKFSEFGDDYPAEFDIARLNIISQWYDVRTIMTPRSNVKELDYVFTGLLDPHRKWQFAFVGGNDSVSYSNDLDSIFFNKETGLFYRAEMVDTYTALKGEYNQDYPNIITQQTTVAKVEDVDYNQQIQRGDL